MKNMHFCLKGPAILKISQQIILKSGNLKPGKFFKRFSFLRKVKLVLSLMLVQ